MARILFTCHDAGGTVPPVLATASALVERGHEVTILSQPSVEQRALALGCDFLAFSGVGDYRRDAALEEQLDRSVPALVDGGIGADLVAAADAIEADVLVVDPNLSGALAAAESLDVPSAVLLHSMFRTFVDVWFGELWSLLADPINATRRGFHVEAVTSWAEMLCRHELVLSAVPAVFDDPSPNAPEHLRHVGFLVPATPPHLARSIELPPGDAPLVVVSFSTTYQHQETAVEETLAVLADEDVRVVVTTSGYDRGIAPPPNCVLTGFVPHAALFEYVDLVVTHGGLGTVAAALQAGVPLVCRPMGRDQPLNAARVRDLGAGLVHATDAGPDELRRTIRDVLGSGAYAGAARRVSEASRAAGEAAAAASAIEALVA